MFFQPGSILLIVGQNALHMLPEIPGVIHVGQVAELMHDHVVQYLGRCKKKSVVKGQGSKGGAASPAGFLVSYGNGGIAASGVGKEIRSSCLKNGFGGVSIASFHGLKPFFFGSR